MVSIPQKDDKGQLVITNVETAQDGIHFGYLDMTQENILDQAKKLVGMAYGWGDSNGDMDCSSTMNAIYRCFGIILPRNTGSMAQTGTQIVSLEGMTQEEKLEKIQSMKPGTLLVMKNHVVMYIGQENGEDLILHNFTTCMAEDGVSTKEVYQCQITQLNLVTAAGTQYLDAYATAICLGLQRDLVAQAVQAALVHRKVVGKLVFVAVFFSRRLIYSRIFVITTPYLTHFFTSSSLYGSI